MGSIPTGGESRRSSVAEHWKILVPFIPAARSCAVVKAEFLWRQQAGVFTQRTENLQPLVPSTRVSGVVKARVTSTQESAPVRTGEVVVSKPACFVSCALEETR